jgi:hypothetical protein
VDHWVSYALSHAAPPPAGIELDLRFNRAGLCPRPYGLRGKAQPSRKRSRSTSSSSSPNDSEEDENEDPRPRTMPRRRMPDSSSDNTESSSSDDTEMSSSDDTEMTSPCWHRPGTRPRRRTLPAPLWSPRTPPGPWRPLPQEPAGQQRHESAHRERHRRCERGPRRARKVLLVLVLVLGLGVRVRRIRLFELVDGRVCRCEVCNFYRCFWLLQREV